MAFLQLNYHSQVLGMDTGVYIIMPEKSQEIGQKGMSGDVDEFPVLWLLHGRSNDETMWLRKTSIERYVGSLGMMVVMPSVGYSRYQNMKYGPRYYDFMTEELPAFLKKMFPKMSMEREKNYLAGLSMGGGGSMHIGLRNTDKYGTICMLSTGGGAMSPPALRNPRTCWPSRQTLTFTALQIRTLWRAQNTIS